VPSRIEDWSLKNTFGFINLFFHIQKKKVGWNNKNLLPQYIASQFAFLKQNYPIHVTYVHLLIYYTIASKDETGIPGWMSTPKTCVVKDKGLDYQEQKNEAPLYFLFLSRLTN